MLFLSFKKHILLKSGYENKVGKGDQSKHREAHVSGCLKLMMIVVTRPASLLVTIEKYTLNHRQHFTNSLFELLAS